MSLMIMITHSSHNHRLALRCSQRPFQCEGCKEVGIGACYQCEDLNCCFFLHDACAEASNSPTAFHPFFPELTFKFYSHPTNSNWCHACGKDIQGFHFNSPFFLKDVNNPILSSINFHPVCLKLKYKLQNNDGLTLHLREKVSFSRFHMSSILRKKCQHCNSTKLSGWIEGWAYVSSDGNYRYHVACVRDIMIDKWKTSHFQGNTIGYIANGASPLDVIPSSSQTGVVQHNNNSSGSSTFGRMARIVLSLISSAIYGEATGIFFAAAAAAI